MADIRYYTLYDAATGAEYAKRVTVDLDDADTAIDEATGQPFSRSGLRGIAAPAVLASKGLVAVEAQDEGGRKIDPQERPDSDPDGAWELDAVSHRFKVRSGAEWRRRQLEGLREREAALEADMTLRGETVPLRTPRG